MKLVTGKKAHKIVVERSQGLCEICDNNDRVQHHHIVGGNGKRAVHENQLSLIALCWDCHYGKYGWHGSHGRPFQVDIRMKLQDKYRELGYPEEEVRRMMGDRLYSKEDMKEKV